MKTIIQRQYLTASELAQVLGVSRNTVQKLTHAGMPYFYAGVSTKRKHRSALRYDLAKVQTWLEERTQEGGQA